MAGNSTTGDTTSGRHLARGLWWIAAGLWIVVALSLIVVIFMRAGVLTLPGSASAALHSKIAALEARITAGTQATSSDDCAPLTEENPTEAANHVLPRGQLVEGLEHGTVLVLTQQASGSGFFVAPDLIVTNRHVIADDKVGEVIVTSKALGTIVPGRVIARTPDGPPGSADFALIQVRPVASAKPMPIRADVQKLEHVVAAGYPGMVLDRDEGFKKLASGDVHAAPDLNLSDGTVTSVQVSSSGISEILHSATVLKGNSGGPLVDSCGDVTGINTFIEVDNTQSGHLNYSLSARNLLEFLNKVHAPVTLREGPCG